MENVSVCVMAAAAAVLWAGGALAGNEAKPGPLRPTFFAAAAAATNKPMPVEQREERRFLKDAAAASRFESEAARMVLGKSSDPAVRSFAAALINHHASATATLQHMLHVRGMAPPMLDNDQRKTLNRLAKLSGRKFDREYMDEVGLKNQQQELLHYENAGASVSDPALKSWIARTVPTLRYHLAMAERITPPEPRLAKAAAPGKAAPAQPARQASARPVPANPFVTRADLATQFMGAGPAQRGMQQPGGTMELGTAKPVATRPTASSSR